jgi:hypothetical protein
MIPKCIDQDFLWYRYGKYQEILTNTDQKIPIRCTTLKNTARVYVGTKTRKFPLPVMDMPVRVLGSVHVLAFFWDPLPELYKTTGYQFVQITSSSNALERGGTIHELA